MNTGDAALQTSPAVALDSSGGSVVVWGNGGAIVGRRYDRAGRPLGGEFVANANGAAFHSKPAVATHAGGGFVVVWENFEPEPSDYVIRGQRYDASRAAVGGEFHVDSAATDRQYHPVVVVDQAGGFLVAWEGHTLARNAVDFSGIFARRYDASGEPVGEEFQINSADTRFAGSPAMAMDSAGNLVVVWEGGGADGTAGIFGRRYDTAGVPIGSEFQISDPIADAQFAPAVAADVSGGFVVVWQRAATFISQVVGRRFGSDGIPIGGVFSVAADTGYTHSSPAVATFPSGNFLVIWERADLSQPLFGPGDIAAQHYLPGGAPDGGQIIVHDVRGGDQRSPALSADASGNLVVVWHRLAGDGFAAGIFGRRYAVSSPFPPTLCACDCDGDQRVGVAELVRGINVLLRNAPRDTCHAADVDDDGAVTIAELVAAVNHALAGCPA